MKKLGSLEQKYGNKDITYDIPYDFLEGWIAYARNANTFNLRKRIMGGVDNMFYGEISSKEYNWILKENPDALPLFPGQTSHS